MWLGTEGEYWNGRGVGLLTGLDWGCLWRFLRRREAGMGDVGLVELARKFVELSDELEAIRGEIKLAVLNGAGDSHRPFVSVALRGGGDAAGRERKRPSEQLLGFSRSSRIAERGRLRSRWGRTPDDGGSAEAMRKRGEVAGGGYEGWRLAASA
jgi:hypothetical protein